jgi:diaminohydroxyphosphoribosylaminopyrimidine deaminase/5-amino-6-(5-phosphoribosylamino)uracil reductase
MTAPRPAHLSIDAALQRAFEIAQLGPAHGPNPRVGCVILAHTAEATPPGELLVLGEGFHRGAGQPHAEIEALLDVRARGFDPVGATAVVTLEPCAHQGRTPPCAPALLQAGISHVVYALTDPNPRAQGGGAYLRAQGVEITPDAALAQGQELVRAWYHAVTTGRPLVTLKTATSIDGRIAARDGTSRWITSPAAREHAHAFRAQVDAVIVGTGTAIQDNPSLTARTNDPTSNQSLNQHQPLRVVMGLRDIPQDSALRGPGGELIHARTHDPAQVLDLLAQREVRHVLIEGGGTVAAAFLGAGLVDDLHSYVAPVILGAGTAAVADFGVQTLADAPRWHTVATARLGDDVFVHAERRRSVHGSD